MRAWTVAERVMAGPRPNDSNGSAISLPRPDSGPQRRKSLLCLENVSVARHVAVTHRNVRLSESQSINPNGGQAGTNVQSRLQLDLPGGAGHHSGRRRERLRRAKDRVHLRTLTTARLSVLTGLRPPAFSMESHDGQ